MIFTMINSNNYKELLDKETGEVIQLPANFIDNRQDYYIRHKSQDKAYKNKLQWAERATENFYWSNLDNINVLLKKEKISMTALGLLLLLGCELNNGRTTLSTQKGRPLTTSELIDKTNTPRRTFIRAMDELETCGIIIVEGTARKPIYTINNEYHFVGRNPYANKSARTYIDGVTGLKEAGLSLSEIGFIYSVLPLLAYNRCVLVKDRNNNEEDTNNLHDISSLCEYLGMTRNVLSKYLKMTFEYQFKEGRYKLPVFGKFSAGGSRVNAYLINPVIIRRAVKDVDYRVFESLEDIFKIYRKKIV